MKKADRILIAVLLLVAVTAGAFVFAGREKGGYAVVEVAGETVARLPLSEDTEFLIEESGGTNLLVIKDGKASVTEANCPDCVCVRTGEIEYTGQTIVCMPHKVVVSIEGVSGGPDAAAK